MAHFPRCTYSGISHELRAAVYGRTEGNDIMFYCAECRDKLPPCPSNLQHPPKPIEDQAEQLSLFEVA